MKNVNCKNCGHSISKEAPMCPQCGHPNKAVKSKKKSGCLPLIFFVVVVGVLASAFSDGDKPTTSKTAAKQSGKNAEELAAEEANCRADLQCWGNKHSTAAGIRCKRPIERAASYSFEWTDKWYEPKVSHFGWKNKEAGLVTFIGDKVKFQNGFGAWQNMIYECDYDPGKEQVLDVRIREGRL